MDFWGYFSNTLTATGQAAMLALVGAYFTWKKWISPETSKVLSDLIVRLLLPCLIFSSITSRLEPDEFAGWWILPLIALLVLAVGLAISFVVFLKDWREKKDLLALSSMQNAGYLLLPIGQFLHPQEFDLFALYCFLFVLIYNPILWTLGKYLITSTPGKSQFSWKGIITPPMVANILAILAVFSGAREIIPQPVNNTIQAIGATTPVLALFVLGAALGAIRIRVGLYLWDSVRALTIKLIIMPILMILALSQTTIRENYPILADVLILNAASAPATAIILQLKTYGGNLEKSGTIMCLGYILCFLTIPVWLSIWHMIG